MKFIRIGDRLLNLEHVVLIRPLSEAYSQVVVVGGINYEFEGSIEHLEALIAGSA